MQNLLRRCLSSGPTVLCTAADSVSACPPSTRNVLSFGSLRTPGETLVSLQLAMPTATALRLHQPVGCATSKFSRKCLSTATSANTATSSNKVGFFRKNCNGYACRCSFLGCCIVLAKPWIVPEDKSLRSCFAPFTTNCGKDLSETFEGDVDNGEKNDTSLSDMKSSEKCVEDCGDMDKPLKLHRRQKGGSGAVGLQGNPDLLTIPGVGPRNLRKLVEKGFGGVAELKQLYKDKFFGKTSQKMVEFLQSSVGIFHKSHAEKITTFIKESVDEELKDGSHSDVKLGQKKRITLCVEGNISVGKTTFLQRIANETLELQDLVEIVPEPVNKWQDVGPDHFNILDAFYAEPQRYAYTFQNYVFVTRVMQERESSSGIKPLRLMERSVFSDRMVFVRAVHEANWMNEMEISIYDSWFDPVVSSLPGLVPDGFIYLRASPDTCHKRMLLRKREEEGGVTLDYLRDLHDKHENWLFPSQSGSHGILSISELPLGVDRTLHPDIRDRVFYLEGNHMHSSIQKVPALVLDCEPNIDFSKDIEAKREYARQVAKFFEFVKRRQETSDPKAHEESAKGSLPHVMLPHKGGLWMPDKNCFSEAALKSLDLRRTMSIMSG